MRRIFVNVHLETFNAEMESEMLDGEQAGLLTLYSDGQARHPICCSESPTCLVLA